MDNLNPYLFAAILVSFSCVVTAIIGLLVLLLNWIAIPIIIVGFILVVGFSQKKLNEI